MNARFRNLKGSLDERLRLGGIGRLEHGNLGCDRVVTGILLVLRGVHRRVVRDENHHTAVDARIGKRKERVSRHIETNVLHRAGAANAAQGRAERDLRRDLLVGRPFAIDFVVFRGEFRDFG